MTLRRFTMAFAASVTASVTASLLLGAASAQNGPPAPERVALPPSPWLQAVSRAFPNQPVLAVGYAPDPDFAKTLALPAKGSLQERLKAVAYAAGKDRMAYEARKIGRLWALGPAFREKIRTDAGDWTLYDVGDRALFLNRLLSTTSEEQAKRLATEEGLPVPELPQDARRALEAAFRPPVEFWSMERALPPAEGAKGKPATDAVLIRGWGYVREDSTALKAPIDWSRARLRANLMLNSVLVGYPQGGPESLLIWGVPTGREFVNRTDPFLFTRNLNPPVTSYVPNSLKPSDMTGAGVKTPIGLSGMTTVGKVIGRLAEATGQPLTVYPSYTNLPVFLGRPDIPAGDVLDGLRFALSASVRRVGATSTFTWDREGLAAVQLKVRESLEPLARQANRMETESGTGQGWLNLAFTLPFQKGDDFALTDAQRHMLLDMPQDPSQWEARIPWQDMTSEQQFAIRRLAARFNAGIGYAGGLSGNKRKISEDDLKRTYFAEGVGINLEVEIPGVGWVRTGRGAGIGWINRFMLDEVRREGRRIAGEAGPRTAPATRPAALDRPVALNSESRAIMVPLLAPDRLRETLAAMKEHGLNTLLYPAFAGGYTTFPSAVFPQEPRLKENADWNEVARAAEEAGIRLVAYIHTLAWQRAGDEGSWMKEHPDWIDVDVLGRPRAAWFREHGDETPAILLPSVPPANYVRPRVDEVHAKLKALVTEIAHLPGTTGIAFTDFQPNLRPNSGSAETAPPPLGYRPEDREPAIRKTGADPIDSDAVATFIPLALLPVNEANREWRPFSLGARPGEVPRLPIVEDLIRAANSARDDWTVLALNEADPSSETTRRLVSDVPELDVAVATVGAPMPHEKVGMYMPVRPRPDEGAGGAFPEDPVRWAVGFARYSQNGPSPVMILFDFRVAPELIPETLARLGPPDEVRMRIQRVLRPVDASPTPARR